MAIPAAGQYVLFKVNEQGSRGFNPIIRIYYTIEKKDY